MTFYSPKMASTSAFLLGVLTIAAMLTGAFLMTALGGSGGRDLGSNAGGAAFTDAAALIIAAELLKTSAGNVPGDARPLRGGNAGKMARLGAS